MENASLRVSGTPPSACSGAMYSGVPSSSPRTVRPSPPSANDASASFATPKSITRGRARPDDSSTSTFAGLRSRWMMPRRCACSTASHAAHASSTRARTSSDRSSANRVMGSPAMNGIANHGRPSVSAPESRSGAMPGWSSDAIACCSTRKRAAAAGDVTASASTFTATSRRTGCSCLPTNTSPKPPDPIRCRST